jgi:hypothetical protein
MSDFSQELSQILDGEKRGNWAFECLKCDCNGFCTEFLNLHKQIVELHERINQNINRQK